MKASEIRSATVSCSDLEASLRFWRDLVGFEEVWRAELSGGELERAWDLPRGTRATAALLHYDGIETGQLRLVQFHPHSGVHVRTRRDPPWAIGVGALDCNVRDPERTFARLREAGFEAETDSPRRYTLSGLEQSEAVFRTPDHVNLVLVGAMNYPPAMARPGVRGDFSALTVVSQFVAEMDAAARFYRLGLGLEQAFDAWVDDAARPLINEMVGIPRHAELRLAAYRTPGEPDGKALLLATRGVAVSSIALRMRPPNLGIVMMSHAVSDLAGLSERALEHGGELLTEPGELAFGAHWRARSRLVRVPGGALLELYQVA